MHLLDDQRHIEAARRWVEDGGNSGAVVDQPAVLVPLHLHAGIIERLQPRLEEGGQPLRDAELGGNSIGKKILLKILMKIHMKILTNFPSKSYNKKIMKKEFVHVSFSNLSS